jgi:hypothetical protein
VVARAPNNPIVDGIRHDVYALNGRSLLTPMAAATVSTSSQTFIPVPDMSHRD